MGNRIRTAWCTLVFLIIQAYVFFVFWLGAIGGWKVILSVHAVICCSIALCWSLDTLSDGHRQGKKPRTTPTGPKPQAGK